MYIKKVSLTSFRNLTAIQIEPQKGLNICYGQNAQGKTNFLESLYFCAMARSLRGMSEQELIQFGTKQCHIQLESVKEHTQSRIDIHLHKNKKKAIAVNGIALKRLGELFGTLYAISFSPEDLCLVKDGPSYRRRFLDMELCQISPIYYHDLQQYTRVLKQRNHCLKNDDISSKDMLDIWDMQLVEYGKKLIQTRAVFVSRLSTLAQIEHAHLTGDTEYLQIQYRPHTIADELEKKLQISRQRDLILGSTQTGPHKDDLQFFINGKEVRQFGSQGQQRTTVLSTRLAEIQLLKERTGETPILLLDDVFSELDRSRQQYLMQRISGIQSFLTCTGVEDTLKEYVHKDNLYLMQAGEIIPQRL